MAHLREANKSLNDLVNERQYAFLKMEQELRELKEQKASAAAPAPPATW